MSGEKILLVSDSIDGPTGFAVNGQGVAWGLAKDYDVHVLGLQSQSQMKVKIKMHNEERVITQHPNLPRGRERWDFGTQSLPRLLEQLEPDVLLTINDIQMIQHIPNTLYPQSINLKIMDLPSKKLVSPDAIKMEIDSHIDRYKEKYPLDFKWILLGPQDGEPPMSMWKNIYWIADQTVAMSKYGKKIYKNYFNMDVPYIYHGIDTDTFIKRERTQFQDKFVVGNFNRNQPRKQPVRNIRAFARFAKDKPDVLLHMQMDWNDQFGWPIQYFMQMYGISNKVINPAPVGINREQVAQVYSQWDLNVNPTGGEGFGLCGIEGFACGLPYLATDYTTSRELIIEGKPSPRGIPIKVKDLHWQKMDTAAVQRSLIDEEDLANAMNYYYNNKEELVKHGDNAREWAEKHSSMKKIQHQWLSLVKDVLNK